MYLKYMPLIYTDGLILKRRKFIATEQEFCIKRTIWKGDIPVVDILSLNTGICHTDLVIIMLMACGRKEIDQKSPITLQWRHNESYHVSDHQPHDCLLNRSFKAQIKENIKAPRHWPLWGEFTGDRWIPHAKGL